MKTFQLILISFIAVTSTLSGFMMISYPEGGVMNLDTLLLEGTPFKNFLVPGILLAGLVGASNSIAVYTFIAESPSRYNWSIAGGALISAWIIIQMIMIQSLHWLHLVYLIAGILIMLIAYQLKGKWAA